MLKTLFIFLLPASGLTLVSASSAGLTPLTQEYYDRQQLTCMEGCSEGVAGQRKQLDFCWCYCHDLKNDIKKVADAHSFRYEEQIKRASAEAIPNNAEVEECVSTSGI